MLLKRYLAARARARCSRTTSGSASSAGPTSSRRTCSRELEIGDPARRPRNTGMLFNIALNYGGRAEIVDAARRAMRGGHRARRSRRAALRRVPLHRRPARSGSADPHQRRDARQQFPALADRLRGDLGHRDAVARLPPRHLLEAVLAYQKRDRRYGGITSRRRRPMTLARRQVTRVMTRVLSGAALIAIAVGVVWFAPPTAVFSLVAAALARARRVVEHASRWPRPASCRCPVVAGAGRGADVRGRAPSVGAGPAVRSTSR